MYELSNKLLRISISALGAELQSIQSVADGIEYLWQGDPDIWSGRAPILFPIVGTLKDGRYNFQQKTYQLPRHGLARASDFRPLSFGSDNICLELASDQKTRKVFPWDFRFQVLYRLRHNSVDIEYTIANTGTTPMRFTVGSHPAFNLAKAVGHYRVYFSERESLQRYVLNDEGLLAESGLLYELKNQCIPLHASLFNDDALVFKHIQSNTISLCDESQEVIRVQTGGAPHLGIWSKPAAPFVCIEPWFGYSDSINATGSWDDKPSMQILEAGSVFSCRWAIEIVSVGG